MRSNVRLAESSIERTARLLSLQFGIRVVWKSGECKTDGNTIYLPTLPSDAPSELLAAVHGFLDHETAHVLFTDFKAIKERTPTPTATQFHCINVIEDNRVEAAVCRLFPGSVTNLAASNDWMVPKIRQNWQNINQFMRACTAYGNFVAYGKYTDFWMHTVDEQTKLLVDKCVDAVGPVANIVSTDLAIEAGFRMFEVLKEYAEEEEEDRKKREKQKSKQTATIEAGGTPSSSQPVSQDQLGELLGQEAAALVSKSGKNATGYKHDADSDKTYIVFSTADDTVKPFPDVAVALNGQKLQRIRDTHKAVTNVLRTRLVNSLRAQARRRWVGSKEEGKVDSRKLYRSVLGTDNAVYKQLANRLHIDTAVCLAIDHSGSMVGRKLDLAGTAAIVLGDVLDSLRIPFAAYAYSTDQPTSIPADCVPYARWNSLWIRYYRDFNEPWEKGALRLSEASTNIRSNTLDAESVKHGIRRLLLRKEKRKILFVFNDGMPYPGHGHVGRCQQHLLDVVSAASEYGIEIVAFGIQSTDVRQYYPNSVVIQRLEDFTEEPLKVLDRLLRKGIRLK
jgi:hypothetical protein